MKIISYENGGLWLLFFVITWLFEAQFHVSQTVHELTYVVEDDLELLIFLPPPP